MLLLGYSRRFKGMSLRKLVSTWERMSRNDRISAYKEIGRETSGISHATAHARAVELWGISDEKENAIDRRACEVMDNQGSPADISRLLELVITGAIAKKHLTEDMVEIMSLCDARQRLPSKIPEDIRVANKTGSVPGTINDCAVIFPRRKAPIICTCLTRGVKHRQIDEVEEAISDIGLAAYETLGR